MTSDACFVPIGHPVGNAFQGEASTLRTAEGIYQ